MEEMMASKWEGLSLQVFREDSHLCLLDVLQR